MVPYVHCRASLSQVEWVPDGTENPAIAMIPQQPSGRSVDCGLLAQMCAVVLFHAFRRLTFGRVPMLYGLGVGSGGTCV